ncbi:MAG: alpha/beta hydrolase family protein [Pedobacter sp.]|nr:alpha/beta hydrolase family protein [Pedobacter sp.]MDQ8052984.1 alpha/beta hydrolase family protein [Pedobacter sp.]
MKSLLLNVALLLSCSICFAGQIETIKVHSASMQKEIPCTIIYPDSYKTSKSSYPVVYLLHGRSGNYTSWLSISPALEKYVDQYQLIVVCPDGGDYSWYLDSPVLKDFRYETFTANELIGFVDKNYRTIADKGHRAIAGLSMGGHGAVYLSIKHQDVFGAAASISGGLDMREIDSSMRMVLPDIKDDPEIWKKHSVYCLADSLKNGQLALSIDCGVADGFIKVNRNVHQRLLELKIDHDYTERPGGHTGEYWGNSLKYQLIFFDSFFKR